MANPSAPTEHLQIHYNEINPQVRQYVPNGAVNPVTNPLIDSILHDFYFGRELSDLAERALRETGATGTAIALKRGELFVCCASAGETAPDVGTHVDSSAGLTGACIRDAVTTICDDTRSDARLDPTVCEELGIASVIAVPIVRSGATVGVIEALSSEPHAFGPEQQALLETLAGEIQAKDFSEPWTKHEANDDAVAMASLVEPEHTQDAPELPT
ncbi:MAG: GAF domain-containing protein, partial [Burkholderiales bacterium]